MYRFAGNEIIFVSAVLWSTISFLDFSFVDNTDLIQRADDVYTTGGELIIDFQVFMEKRNGGIRAPWGFIAATKTRWFLIDLKWTGTGYA